jgi:hypothetical protein
MHHRLTSIGRPTTILLSGLLLLGTGCALSNSISNSISNSSNSISDSTSNSFNWSSESSAKEDSAYREDVSDYTLASARMGDDIGAYRMGLGRIAEQRGITNWEADSLTCAGIGQGLARAHIDEAGLEAFTTTLFGQDFVLGSAGGRDLRAGYESIP